MCGLAVAKIWKYISNKGAVYEGSMNYLMLQAVCTRGQIHFSMHSQAAYSEAALNRLDPFVPGLPTSPSLLISPML